MFAGFGLGRGPPIGIVRERPRLHSWRSAFDLAAQVRALEFRIDVAPE